MIFRSLQRRAAASEPRCLAVRCPVGQLRVIAIWQILGHYASRVLRTHVINDSKHACEELSLTLVDISDDALSDMVVRLSDLPWVLDAWFYP